MKFRAEITKPTDGSARCMIYNQKHELVCETTRRTEVEVREQARMICDAIATHAYQQGRGGVVFPAAIDWF